MKKIILSFAMLFFVLFSFAQPHKIRPKAAYKFLNRTNKILKLSLQQAKPIEVYTGGFAAGHDMQLKAIKEFKTNHFQRAVNDSYIARRLAFRAYKANTTKPISQKWRLTPKEKLLVSVNVTPMMLNKIIKHEYIQKEQNKNFMLDDVSDLTESDIPAPQTKNK